MTPRPCCECGKPLSETRAQHERIRNCQPCAVKWRATRSRSGRLLRTWADKATDRTLQ